MDREQARAEYRKILAGVVRHHQAIDRHVTGIAMARIAKRLGLRVKGGIIEAGDDAMTLVSNLTEPSDRQAACRHAAGRSRRRTSLTAPPYPMTLKLRRLRRQQFLPDFGRYR